MNRATTCYNAYKWPKIGALTGVKAPYKWLGKTLLTTGRCSSKSPATTVGLDPPNDMNGISMWKHLVDDLPSPRTVP